MDGKTKALLGMGITLVFLIALMLWQNFSPIDDTKEDKVIKDALIKIEEHTALLNEIKTLSKEQIESIDATLKTNEYYYELNNKQRNEKINNYYNNTDSTQFSEWAESALKFRNSSPIK